LGFGFERMERGFKENDDNHRAWNINNYYFGFNCWVWQFVEIKITIDENKKTPDLLGVFLLL
jgi:hypothetical protein